MKPLVAFAGVATFVILLGFTGTVAAQSSATPVDNYGTDRVEARFVGLTGGVVLGAEVVLAVQAAFGIDTVWPYLVFPVVGAAGGGVGGYFLEKKSVPGSVALLIAGIALVIPTTIFTSMAFAYNPEKEGAEIGDDNRGGELSFELPPTGTSAPPEDDKAVTEVEAKPDVGPPGPVTLPPPGESATPPEEAAPDEAPAEAAPEETPSEETAPTSRYRGRDSHRLAMGTLLYVRDDGSAGLGIPAPHIRPAAVYDTDGRLLSRRGVEVMVPLLVVALP